MARDNTTPKTKTKSKPSSPSSSPPKGKPSLHDDGDADPVAAESTVSLKGKDNTVLITTGYRFNRMMENVNYATLDPDNPPGNMDDLMAQWSASVSAVPPDAYVSGAGAPGIFTPTLTRLCGQLAPLDQCWAISVGLGLVNLEASYPAYDLGDNELNMSADIPDFDPRKWWSFVCGLSGNTIADVVHQAIAANKRVVIAVAGQNLYDVRDDLAMIAEPGTFAEHGCTLEDVHKHVRFVGGDLRRAVPGRFQPCVMLYDQNDLDRLLPGGKSTSAKRAAFLLAMASPVKTSGASDPLKDYTAMTEMLAQKSLDDGINFDSGSRTATSGPPREKLNDADATALIQRKLKVLPPDANAISRMLRDEGYSMTAERAQGILNEINASTGTGKSRK